MHKKKAPKWRKTALWKAIFIETLKKAMDMTEDSDVHWSNSVIGLGDESRLRHMTEGAVSRADLIYKRTDL